MPPYSCCGSCFLVFLCCYNCVAEFNTYAQCGATWTTMAGSQQTQKLSAAYRLLDKECLICLGENMDAQLHQGLDSCRTVHEDVDKQCKHCPLWYHGCLSKTGSEELQKCNRCNSKVDLGSPDDAILPLTTYVGVGICLGLNKTTMDPKDFYVHTSILATRIKEEWSYTIPFTVDSQAKVVRRFPPEGFFAD